MCNKTKKAGFTLVEVLVAVVIVGLVLTAIAAAISFSVKNSSQADYRQVATRYAQDAIDIIRQKRATDGWSTFYTTMSDGTYCVRTSNNNLVKTSDCSLAAYELTNNQVVFERTIAIVQQPGPPQSVQIEVTVEWKDGSATRDVTVVQKLFDY